MNKGKNAADFYICIEHCSNAKNWGLGFTIAW